MISIRILSRVLTAVIVATLGLGLNMTPASAAPCAPSSSSASNGFAPARAPQPKHHKTKHHKAKHVGAMVKGPGHPGGGIGQRAGLSAAPDRQHLCGPKAPHQAMPPGEALAPPVGDPVTGSPVGATNAGVLDSTGSGPDATADAAAASGVRATHPRAVRPAHVSRLAAIPRLARRMMNEAGPVVQVLAAEATLATFPLLLTALMVVAYALMQRWIDRGDPRLATNAAPEAILPFT